MKVRVIIGGDSHYDLKTEGLDRTDDIDNAKNQIIDYVIDLSDDVENVAFLDAGDLFHGTRPSERAYAKSIRTIKKLSDAGIPTAIIAGNHDVIDQKGRTSALEPLVAFDFPYINIYHDLAVWSPYKGLNIVMVPHISKAKAVEEGFKSVQEYIDHHATYIEKHLDEDDYNIVIAHMNIAGAKTGTETYMIKGAHEDFPEVLKKSDKINIIFNGHIHRSQRIDNPYGPPIIITGDIQVNDFGERLDRKVFFDLEVEI